MLLLEQINNQILVGWSGFFFLFPVALLSPHNEVEFFDIFFFSSTLRLVWNAARPPRNMAVGASPINQTW